MDENCITFDYSFHFFTFTSKCFKAFNSNKNIIPISLKIMTPEMRNFSFVHGDKRSVPLSDLTLSSGDESTVPLSTNHPLVYIAVVPPSTQIIWPVV